MRTKFGSTHFFLYLCRKFMRARMRREPLFNLNI